MSAAAYRHRYASCTSGPATMNRFTFIVQIHPDGISTLENLATHERVRISDLETIGPRIESWLAEQSGAGTRSRDLPEEDGQGGAPGAPDAGP